MRFRIPRPLRPFRTGPPMRWGGPPGPRGPALAGAALQQLANANRLLALGQAAQAAAIFAALAAGAEVRHMPRRAAQLHLQLLRCYAATDWPRALSEARVALKILMEAGLQAQASLIFAGSLAELRQGGLNAAAEELEREVQQALGGAAAAAPPARQLPPKCPQCGGAVRSDEVEWIDERSAVCDYCGSTLPAA